MPPMPCRTLRWEIATSALQTRSVGAYPKHPWRVLAVRLVAALCVAVAPSLAAAQPLAVRGRVTSADGRALAGATVTATPLGGTPAGAPMVAIADSSGAYSLLLPQAVARWELLAALRGFAPERRAVEFAPNAATGLVVDFRLSTRAAPTLAPVRTVAERPRPRRDVTGTRAGPGTDPTALDRGSGANGDVTGNLDAALAMLTDVSLTPDGTGGFRPSAFGIGADQIGITLNGMDLGSGGASVPRDGLVATLRLSSYDPRNGRAAGPIVSFMLPGGQRLPRRGLRVTTDEPALQLTSPTVEQLGARAAHRIVSGTAFGPLRGGRQFYAATVQLGRRESALPTLTSPATAVRSTLGVAPDTVARLLALAQAAGVPLAAPSGADAGGRITNSASGLVRLDLTPWATSLSGSGTLVETTGNVFYLLAGGNWSEHEGRGASPLAAPSRLDRALDRGGQLLANFETYLGDALSVTKASAVASDSRVTPYVSMPRVSVLAASGDPDASDGYTALQLGGSGNGTYRQQSTRWQLSHDVTWVTLGQGHRFNAYADMLWERVARTQQPNAIGGFTYRSLDDLAANRPLAFTRTLGGVSRTELPVWRGALALSDVYRPLRVLPGPFGGLSTEGLTVQYGVRVDAERFGNPPPANALVAERFGRRTDRLPQALAVQPMVGFTWNRGITTIQSAGAKYLPTRHIVTGGVRSYRGVIPTLTGDPLARQTGLAGGTRELRCVGDAVPAPDWRAYARSPLAIPSECADLGDADVVDVPDVLVESAPSVRLLAPDFTAVRSWRGELRWRWAFSGHFASTVGATQAINLGLPSTVDLNFAPRVGLTLPEEADRPVFTEAGSIVPGTGAVTLVGSRRHPEFARVLETRADGRTMQRNLTAGLAYYIGTQSTVAPMAVPPRVSGVIEASYTHTTSRERTRGFDRTTGSGTPDAWTWSAGVAPRHSLQLSVSTRLEGWGSLAFTGRMSSGFPFTPLVGGDLNADGRANDRAFVFDPAAASDSAVADGMQRLLREAPDRVRNCLARQLGRIATQHGCRGPWTASLGTIALTLDPHRFRLGYRTQVSLYLTNALGGVDQLLHSRNARGWGAMAFPDPTLLAVRGFDAESRRYRYAVNPRFGSTAATGLLWRQPTALTVDVRLDIGPNRETQAIRRLFNPRPLGLGLPLHVDTLRRRLLQDGGQWSGATTFRWVTDRARQLALTPAQLDSLRLLDQRARATRDSIYADLAKYLVSREGAYGGAGVRAYWHRAVVAAATVACDLGMQARAVLTPAQHARIRQWEWPPAVLECTPAWIARVAREPVILPH